MVFTNNYEKANDPPLSDLTISKTVTGDFSDSRRYFNFSVNFTLPVKLKNIPSYFIAYVLENGAAADPASNADSSLIGTDSEGKNYIMVSASTETQFKLKSAQKLLITGIPAGTIYKISELSPTGYIPSYTVTEDSIAAPGVEGTAHTSIEAADLFIGESANGVDFINTRIAITPTGVTQNDLPFVSLLALTFIGFVAYFGVKMYRVKKGRSF
jgi:hypothetical protein